MSVIKNEKGKFVEFSRDEITFYGNTEEERKANELIFDLSLENDALTQEIKQLNNIIDELEKYGHDTVGKYLYDNHLMIKVEDFLDKLNELKGDNK